MRGEATESLHLFLISLCTLAFEMVLFRWFAFLAGFHFVSLIISLALLGYGASGALFRFFPLSMKPLIPLFFIFGMAAGLVGLVFLPIDVYEFWTYLFYKINFILLIIITSIPFFFHGLYQIHLFDKYPGHFPRFYSINLLGSAVGVIIGVVLLLFLSEIQSLIGIMGIGCLNLWKQKKHFFVFIFLISILFFSPLTIKISDYSPTRQLRLIPDNQLLSTYRNPSQYLEVFFTPYSRAATGLSMRYRDVPPSSYSLITDHTHQIIFPYQPSEEFIHHTLFTLPLRVFNPDEVLCVECDWGYEMYAMYYSGVSGRVITSSPLYRDFLKSIHPSIPYEIEVAFPRKYFSQMPSRCDLIFLKLPIGNAEIFPGSFSMKENYLFTVEGIRSAVNRLNDDGKLVISFFPQTPPVVLLKLMDLVSQVWGGTKELQNRMIIIKNLDFSIMILSNQIFDQMIIEKIRLDTSVYGFDFIYYPGISEGEAEKVFQNRKLNYQIVMDYLQDPVATLQKSSYQVEAPRDNKPYFFHFFKWDQLKDTLYNLGKRWLPFGGAGFLFVLFILLVITGLSLLFILIPGRALLLKKKKLRFPGARELELAAILTGVGYMLIEIPIIVQLEIIIGFPIYTFALVLTVLLVFSGLGSRYVENIRSNQYFLKMIFTHPLIILGFFLSIHYLGAWLLELPGILSLLVILLPFSLLAFTAGMPFPILSKLTHQRNPNFFQVVFAWNGFMSVIASLLSHFAAIEFGIHFAYLLSMPIYGFFWIIVYYLKKTFHSIT